MFVFNLEGATNVLLFLIVRPELLLFYDPDIGQPSAPDTSSMTSNNTAKDNHSPQPMVALSHIESRSDI